jgi:hypothetical protein
VKELQKWDTRLKLIKVANMLIIPFFVLSISIIGLTIYSRNVGNFVIRVSEASEAVLSLSESPEFREGRNILLAQGVNNMRDTTYKIIPVNITEKDGSNNDNRKRQYACYSFYLKNISDADIGYQARIEIIQVSRNVDEAVRVMVEFEGERTIYKKHDDRSFVEMIGEENNPGYYNYETTDFEGNSIVFSQHNPLLRSGSYVRYSVLIWLEGWDEDCNDSIRSGDIKMEMHFAVIGQR